MMQSRWLSSLAALALALAVVVALLAVLVTEAGRAAWGGAAHLVSLVMPHPRAAAQAGRWCSVLCFPAVHASSVPSLPPTIPDSSLCPPLQVPPPVEEREGVGMAAALEQAPETMGPTAAAATGVVPESKEAFEVGGWG